MIDQQKALDLLRELNTIGAGRVATALSEMLGAMVELDFPEAEFISLKSLIQKLDRGEKLFIVETNLEGDLIGRLSFLLEMQYAQILGSSLLKKNPGEIDPRDPLFQSSLRETVNIFGGSYTEVLAEMTHLNIFYNVPFLNLDSVESYLRSIPNQFFSAELIFYINTMVKVENMRFKGALLFLLDYDSIRRLFEAMGQSELVLWMELMKLRAERKRKDGQAEPPDIKHLSS
jgi:chemotaxis protein CheY-P-specific phosphatase CheC